jgi:hypothetical protein
MENFMQIVFLDWTCNVVFTKYFDGNTAIQLVDAEDGAPIATATINVPDAELPEDQVVIKDYSENAGMLDVLYEAGIISDPIGFVMTGFVPSPICKLLKGAE